jgi:hypothetical protein
MVPTRPSAGRGRSATERERHRLRTPEGLYETGRTPCGNKPERMMPACSPFGARMQRPEPAHTEQSLARPYARPTKGGAVRIRIALTTAAAVILIPVVLLTMFTSSPAASARASARHQASLRHRITLGATKLMSYSQAEQAAKRATFYNAVISHERAAYLEALVAAQQAAYYRAVELRLQEAAAQAAAAAAAADPAPAPAPTPTTAPLPPPAAAGSDATSTNTPDWACIREHESDDDYSEYNGGAYQFELGTWVGLTGLPDPAEDYPPAVQDAAALKLYSERGWEPWSTRFVCGL